MCPHFIHEHRHAHTHYFNRCQMANVLDIQFTFGNASAAVSPSWSHCTDQQLQQSTVPAGAGGTVAPGPGVTHFVMEEKCLPGQVLRAPVELGRRKLPKSVPIPRKQTLLQVGGGHSPRKLCSEVDLSLPFCRGAFGELKG